MVDILSRMSICERASIDECYLDLTEEAHKRLAACHGQPLLPVNPDRVHVCGQVHFLLAVLCHASQHCKQLWLHLRQTVEHVVATSCHVNGKACHVDELCLGCMALMPNDAMLMLMITCTYHVVVHLLLLHCTEQQ